MTDGNQTSGRSEPAYADLEAHEAAVALGAAWKGVEVGVVLGSGLACAAAGMEVRVERPYDSVRGLGPPGVQGHAGRLLRGTLGGVEIVAFLGRRHLYEGITPAEAGFPARLAAALGGKLLVCLSAVGGVHPDLPVGSWVFVEDHLNLMGRNPLEGVRGPEGPAFVDLTAVYRRDLYGRLDTGLRRLGFETARGVLAAFCGPTYETPAEVRMAGFLGAAIVGMSTVPEAVWARYLGLDVLAWGRVANHAAGVGPGTLRHDEVVARMGERPDEARAVLEESVTAWVFSRAGKTESKG